MKLQNVFPQTWKLLIVTFGCLLLIVCAGFVKQSKPSEVVSLFIQKSKELKSGMTKAEVHSMVGAPYISSEYLKFEIFQIISERKEHAIMILPVPLWVYENQDYTPVLLVTYHDDRTVKDYEWDIYDESETGDGKHLLIELSGYTLIYSAPDLTGTMLFAPTEVSEQVISDPLLGDHCALYVIVPDQPMEDRNQKWVTSYSELFLNDKPLIHPYHFPKNSAWFPDVLEATVDKEFIAIELPEGVHEIELRGSNGSVNGSAKNKFTCFAGKTIFADIQVEFIDQGYWKWKYRYRIEGEISISDHWPKETKARRQVLMHRDEWYGLDYQK